ncbi:hypothetical protein Fcan01_18501 [Folsomia candida]|uniref:Uncharacterized protein n=1 Tax=Folsomia candida TaxID=158441 RepID=A0A226DN67_FOLCA|nr:hypothetical protein Fcan01_18501 [Folsomia candida]
MGQKQGHSPFLRLGDNRREEEVGGFAWQQTTTATTHHHLEESLMGSNNSASRGLTTQGIDGSNISNNSSTSTSRATAAAHQYNTRSSRGVVNDNNNIAVAEEEAMESESDSDSGADNGTSTRRITEDLISVFQVLIRNGQIHIMSSEEDSGDESYSPTANRKVVAPRSDYAVDTSVLEKNDLKLTMGNDIAGNEQGDFSLPRLLASREMGNISRFSGFDKPHRNRLSETFLPNTINRVANYGYKAFCGTYSKKGDIFLCASQDRAIRIYDTTNGRFSKFKKIMARDVGWSVLDTAFSPDGRSVIYSSWSESCMILDQFG